MVCDGADHGVAFDLTWTGSFPPWRNRPTSCARAGASSSTPVASPRSARGRVRSCRGRGAVGRRRPLGRHPGPVLGYPARRGGASRRTRPRPSPRSGFGFWWTYVPLRFDDFAIVIIAQEDGDGTRLLNEAVRVFPAASGRPPEQLGWPEVEVRYRPGTRHPEAAVLHMRTRGGKPLTLEIDTLGFVGLNCGPGLRRRPRLVTRPMAGTELHRRCRVRHARPGHHGPDPVRGRRPRGPRHLRRSRGLGDVRARDIRPPRAVGLHADGNRWPPERLRERARTDDIRRHLRPRW